jgi:NedA-like, galactose-binding domain
MQVLQTEKVDPSFAIDENQVSRWASQPFEEAPQWLELNWTGPHEIVAVKAYFESAYANDYLIQTWDEEKSVWLTQANITGNNEQIRVHPFEEPVNTTKLRIYVTKFSDFEMVSLYELETYERSVTISDQLPVYHEGLFQCFIRASSTSENGRIYLKLGDESSDISLFNASSQYQWFDTGTFNLTAGDQELSLGSLGRVSISQVVLYSLLENENTTNLSELFAKSENSATIKYDQLNPCTYRLQIDADKPFLLVFSETYNPLWKAIVDSEEISAFPVYSFLNGFFINKTGSFTMTLYFTGQDYVDIGLKIASASFLVSMVVVLTPFRAFRKLAPKIRPTQKG